MSDIQDAVQRAQRRRKGFAILGAVIYLVMYAVKGGAIL